MEGIRGRYKRALRKSVGNELEEARVEFQTKIAAAINEAKRYELGVHRDVEEIQRDQEYTAMYLEGRINFLLG